MAGRKLKPTAVKKLEDNSGKRKWCIYKRCRQKCFGINLIEDIGIISDILQRLEIETMERLTRSPEIKYGGTDNDMAVARYTLAVNRRYKKDGEQEADFISCVVFEKGAIDRDGFKNVPEGEELPFE